MTRKKPRRVVLGVGHPWYFSQKGHMEDFTSVCLYDTEASAAHPVSLNYQGTGNWNRVRLVMEILPPKRRKAK